MIVRSGSGSAFVLPKRSVTKVRKVFGATRRLTSRRSVAPGGAHAMWARVKSCSPPPSVLDTQVTTASRGSTAIPQTSQMRSYSLTSVPR